VNLLFNGIVSYFFGYLWFIFIFFVVFVFFCSALVAKIKIHIKLICEINWVKLNN
jgi:hypothetical protein